MLLKVYRLRQSLPFRCHQIAFGGRLASMINETALRSTVEFRQRELSWLSDVLYIERQESLPVHHLPASVSPQQPCSKFHPVLSGSRSTTAAGLIKKI
jgi:hypothetical protein